MDKFCRDCINMRVVSAGDKEPHPVIMFCMVVMHRDGSYLDCFNARDSGICGPEGSLYEHGASTP